MIIFFQEGGRRREMKERNIDGFFFLAMFCLGAEYDDECWMILAFSLVRVSSMKCCGSHVWRKGGNTWSYGGREGDGQSELMGSVIQN